MGSQPSKFPRLRPAIRAAYLFFCVANLFIWSSLYCIKDCSFRKIYLLDSGTGKKIDATLLVQDYLTLGFANPIEYDHQ